MFDAMLPLFALLLHSVIDRFIEGLSSDHHAADPSLAER
jgi:hypothetical protein